MATLENVWQDVRYALRGLRRSPTFAATVVATLGLGLGANAAMFGVVDRLMFRPLAFLRDPGSVRRIYWQLDNRGTTSATRTTYYTRYLDLAKWTHSFSQVAAFSERDVAVGDGEVGARATNRRGQRFLLQRSSTRVRHLAASSPPRRTSRRAGRTSPCCRTRSGNPSSARETCAASCFGSATYARRSSALRRLASTASTTRIRPSCMCRSPPTPAAAATTTRDGTSLTTNGGG